MTTTPKNNSPEDNAEWLDEIIDKYRADIMLAAQGMNSDNETYRESATNVAALSSINIKDEIRRHIDTVCREARIDELKKADWKIRDAMAVVGEGHTLHRQSARLENVLSGFASRLTQLNPNKDTPNE